MKQRDEKELLEQLRQSDYSAFEELYQLFWKPLYIHAVKKIGSKEDAFDLVQDLFTELWDKRENIPQVDAPLKYYLRSAIVFKIAIYFRSRGFQEKHEKNYEVFLQQESSIAVAGSFQDSEDNREFEQLIAVINSSIEAMPPKMQQIFLMSRTGKYSIAEIAESLQLSPQTVKNNVSIALQRLRKATAATPLNITQASFLWWLLHS